MRRGPTQGLGNGSTQLRRRGTFKPVDQRSRGCQSYVRIARADQPSDLLKQTPCGMPIQRWIRGAAELGLKLGDGAAQSFTLSALAQTPAADRHRPRDVFHHVRIVSLYVVADQGFACPCRVSAAVLSDQPVQPLDTSFEVGGRAG